jgi:hypothetical protein
MNENQRTGELKSIGDLVKNFEPQPDHVPIFEECVNLTSKLINRSYMQTFKMVEDWQTHKIIRRYDECTKDKKGEIPGEVLWWYLRKKDKERASNQKHPTQKQNANIKP